jgi:hypothetical protein
VVRTQIQLTEAQYAALKGQAEARGCSLAEAIRQAVDNWLQRPATPSRQELLARVLRSPGFESDVPNLVRDHDRYAFEE